MKRPKVPEEGRPARVAERLRTELAELLIRGKVRDPGAREVVVSAVRMSRDLSHARIYVRLLGEANRRRQEQAVAALERASGFLSRELAPRLALRRAPELQFLWDDVVDSASRMEQLLEEVRSESPSEEPR